MLAQLYGFFGLLTCRTKVFNIKLELLNYDVEKGTANAFIDFDCVYTSTLLHLMKAYLNANMFEDLIDLIFDNKFKGIKSNPDDVNKLKDTKISYQNIEDMNKHNKTISSKPETLIAYHLALAHYFILKHQVNRLVVNLP